jgi:hypothetical protein
MQSKVMVQARLSRLMVATQQVWEKHDMEVLDKDGRLRGGDSQKAVVMTIQKLLDI